MKVTQKDIAQKMGVSTSLVSRVLSGQAYKIGVNQQKIDAIMRAAREMNYVPSSAALVLKGKKTRTLGLVVYDFYDPYFSTLIYELQEQAHIHGYSTLLVGFLNRRAKHSDLLPLLKHSVDGIIVLGSFGDLSWTDAFSNIPILRIGHGEHKNISFSVSVDEGDAMGKILSHLKRDVGAENAVYVSTGENTHVARRKAFEAVAGEMSMKFSNLIVGTEGNSFKAGCLAAREMLKNGAKSLPQSIVAANDTIAMGLIKQFIESGVSVPGDVVIAGFDDIPMAANYIPSITSFRQPVKIFAQKCYERMADESLPSRNELEGELIVRKSTMKK